MSEAQSCSRRGVLRGRCLVLSSEAKAQIELYPTLDTKHFLRGGGGRTTRRVNLYYQFRQRWQCQFLAPDLKTSLPQKPVLADSEKLIWFVERGGGPPDLPSRGTLDQATAKGRGGVFLNLSAEQYRLLRNTPRKIDTVVHWKEIP